MQKKLVPIVNPIGRVYCIAAVLPATVWPLHREGRGKGKGENEEREGGRGEEKRRGGVMARGQRWIPRTVNISEA